MVQVLQVHEDSSQQIWQRAAESIVRYNLCILSRQWKNNNSATVIWLWHVQYEVKWKKSDWNDWKLNNITKVAYGILLFRL